MERNGLTFAPGQYVHAGLATDRERREYSVYSPPDSEFLELLIKEFPGGHVSSQLKHMQPGEYVAVDKVNGTFTINEADVKDKRFYFVGTSTGISPFHCFTHSYPDIDYQILHGIRFAEDRFEHEDYAKDRYIACVSRGEYDGYTGRVTDYLKGNPPDRDCLFYLCGNVDMIYEVIGFLKGLGFNRKQIATEVYF
jgi:ferredoxin--NADP+ reductase/benzoate/toluate 1,2-dioxygenase reductase subunit